MNPKLIMTCVFLFLLGTLLSLLIEGTWMGSQEVEAINELTGYTALEVQGSGIWGVMKQTMGFITHGLPKVLMWDYSFFENSGWLTMVQWFLYIISAGVVWGLCQVFIPVVSGMLNGLRGVIGGLF